MKLFIALPNFGNERHNPRAKLTLFAGNQLLIMEAWAAFRLSDPVPQKHLPAKSVAQDNVYPPITIILWPIIKIVVNEKIITLTPNLSTIMPPKSGSTILGAEQTEQSILNQTLFNPISD